MQRFGVGIGIGTGAGTGTGTRIGLDHGEHGIKAADADVEVMHRVNEVWRAIDGLYRRSLKGLI